MRKFENEIKIICKFLLNIKKLFFSLKSRAHTHIKLISPSFLGILWFSKHLFSVDLAAAKHVYDSKRKRQKQQTFRIKF